MGYKRKVYLINPKFQLNIVGKFAIFSMLNIAIFYSCFYAFYSKFYNKGLSLGLPKNHAFFVFLSDQKYIFDSIFVVASAISILALIIFGILLSHKIAGPMYRMRMHLKSCGEEKTFKQVKFRKGDYFTDVQDSFNEMVDKISND
jgi:methyl-accepting chemotaxis protein